MTMLLPAVKDAFGFRGIYAAYGSYDDSYVPSGTLADMNDMGETFQQIASFVRNNKDSVFLDKGDQL
jgi:hypothetical protein